MKKSLKFLSILVVTNFLSSVHGLFAIFLYFVSFQIKSMAQHLSKLPSKGKSRMSWFPKDFKDDLNRLLKSVLVPKRCFNNKIDLNSVDFTGFQ